jgi:hypothetical protein
MQVDVHVATSTGGVLASIIAHALARLQPAAQNALTAAVPPARAPLLPPLESAPLLLPELELAPELPPSELLPSWEPPLDPSTPDEVPLELAVASPDDEPSSPPLLPPPELPEDPPPSSPSLLGLLELEHPAASRNRREATVTRR